MIYSEWFPGRLREAREARGLSRSELAKQIGRSRQALLQFEMGEAKPSPDVFSSLVSKLDVPPQFFDRPPLVPDPNPIFYRKLKSARRRDIAMGERRLAWLQHTLNTTEYYVEFPEVSLPVIEPKSDPRDITDDEIEAAASEARRFWNLGEGAISNVVRLLENHGCIVVRDALGVHAIDAFSQWQFKKHRPIVALSRDDETVFFREQSSAAHELGHLLLHRKIDKRYATEQHDLIELQAHRFAGAFLLPEAAFRSTVRAATLDAFYLLKLQWNVSIGLMIYRCKSLGIIDSVMAARLWKLRTKRGWNRIEPLDDATSPETPRMLAESVGVIRESGNLREWLDRVCLSTRDIAQFASVNIADLTMPTVAPRLRSV